MRGNKCSVGIKELQTWKQIQAEAQILFWLQDEDKGFFEKNKRNNYMKGRSSFYRCWQAELLLAIYYGLLILSSDREFIIFRYQWLGCPQSC